MLGYNIIKCTDNDDNTIFYNHKYGICNLWDQREKIYDRSEIYYEIPFSVISEMNKLENGESIINLSNMELTSLEWLVNYPNLDRIATLYCEENKLIKIPLLSNIKCIDCSYNELEELPLWLNVTVVYCHNNQIKELPLWPNITEVYCCENNIKELPLWPNVTIVYCYYNQIKELPLWPNVTVVNCHNNRIVNLPLWPNVTEVYCDIAKMKHIPYWPFISRINKIDLNLKYKIKRELFWHLVKINRENRKIKMSMKIHELKWRSVNAEIICRPDTGVEWFKFKEKLERN